jgi:AraC-like DNA-binding protein
MDSPLKHYDRNAPLRMSADILLGTLEAAAGIGIDISASLEKSGIDRRLLHPCDAFLPIHSIVDFFNDVAEHAHCDYFGFLVACEQPPSRFSHIGRVIKFASTIGQAINDAISLSLLNSEFSRWELVNEGEYTALIRRTRVALNAPMTQLQTLAITSVYKSINSLSQNKFELHQVHFSHAPTDYRRKMEEYFHAPVSFNQSYNGLVFHSKALDTPIPTADPELYQFLLKQLSALVATRPQQNNLLATVTHHIQSTLGTTKCNFDYISQLLGMHPRKLQRRMRAEGIHFKQLLNDVRQRTAEDFLINSSASILELSDLLGYQNASAFSRAFKRATGLPPAVWQQQHRADTH